MVDYLLIGEGALICMLLLYFALIGAIDWVDRALTVWEYEHYVPNYEEVGR